MADVVTYILVAIMFGCFLSIIWNIWGMSCNDKTYKQRIGYLRIRSVAYNQSYLDSLTTEEKMKWLSECVIIHDGLDAVEYKQHEKALMWFKDPLNLYPEDFRNLVTKSN